MLLTKKVTGLQRCDSNIKFRIVTLHHVCCLLTIEHYFDDLRVSMPSVNVKLDIRSDRDSPEK